MSDNLGQNISGLFHVLAQFLFTTSETELDYYNQVVNVRVASRVSEQLKTLGIREFQENSWNAWIWWQSLSSSPKSQILMFFGKKLHKTSCKTFHRKTYFANFVSFSATFCPRFVDQQCEML